MLAGAVGSGDIGSWATGSTANSGGKTTGYQAEFEGGVSGNVADSGCGGTGKSEVEELVPQVNLAATENSLTGT